MNAPDSPSPHDQARARQRRWRLVVDTAGLYGIVTLGGVIGSLLRWLVALLLPLVAGAWPWATFAANASGCFVIGFYATLSGPAGRVFHGPRTRQFVMTGICGGYTTFSGFSLETFDLLSAGRGWQAALYLAISLASWLVAVWLGEMLASRLNRL